ncbi:hypothetical protein LOTGIDRAFT_232810 [Lottia gigantea]|uniref:Lipid droplet-regulating VLDL assembly factor AUP1 n=1 Tax=Lottia gigantea TaxID=225164 RepID=V3ZNU5_LOTGI|nr:hypothetical protein LOTGIDRAFT_232810 [Lottia gigantea]ESO93048.1 hypothetical protein LOTGIDRAFT_232810 [Lottia gigantea]
MEIQSLFHIKRFPRTRSLVNLVFYFPIGVFLAVVRLFISMHVIVICHILPHGSSIRRFVLKVMSGVLGFLVTVEGGDKLEQCSAKVIVSNHISIIDYFITDLVFPNQAPLENLPSIFIQLISKFKKLPSNVNKDQLLNEVKSICQESPVPVLFHPEKTTTNGESGLLKFNTVPFELDHSIQPIAVQCKRPSYFEINITTLESSWYTDIFWCFFLPCTFYKIHILPVVQKKEDESCEELSERVRSMIADTINITTTDYTYSDKIDYIKQLHRTYSHTSNTNNTSHNNRPNDVQTSSKPVSSNSPVPLSSNPAINNMVQQVKTVMPHVPVQVILKDLEKTKDVDRTLTNILDGIVQFTPEEPESQTTPTTNNTKQQTPCPSTQKFKSDSFGRTTRDRHMSFEERKKAMIEAARQKYKEKHNLL